MISRGLLTTIGATTLGGAIIFGGATAIPGAFAQESTPAVEAPTQAQEASDPDHEARFVEAYNSFVATLASELDVDEAAADAAIRTALKEQVAALETEGHLTAEEVSELQQMIDEAEVPFGFGMGMGGPGGIGGPGGMHGFGGRDGHIKIRGERHGPRDGFEDFGPRDGLDGPGGDIETRPAPENDAPATLPSSGEAEDQSAPVEAAPEGAVL